MIYIILFVSCERDNVIPTNEDGCYDFGTAPGGWGFQYEEADSSKGEPCFITTANDLFVYRFIPSANATAGELRLKPISGTTETVLTTGVYSETDCNNNGWLIFISGGFIRKMKTNGDSLTDLLPVVGFVNPRWRSDGERFSFSAGQQKTYIADRNGVIVDSIPFNTNNGDWSADGTKICFRSNSAGSPTISIWEFGTGLTQTYSVPLNGSSLFSVRWLGNDRLIWNDEKGIYTLSIHSPSTIKTIRQSCDSRVWLNFDVSEDGNYLICGRIDRKLKNPNTILSGTSIHKIRISDGQIVWSN
jgi:hypothetical protein